jgi:hypothetical protein
MAAWLHLHLPEVHMRLFLSLVLLVGTAFAGEVRNYMRGELQEMNSVECGYDEKSGKSFGGSLLGTDSGKMREALGQEYTLVADKVIYRIRPKKDKKPDLLPVGEPVEFRIKKDKLILRVRELDDKEREFLVVSMTPRTQAQARKSE